MSRPAIVLQQLCQLGILLLLCGAHFALGGGEDDVLSSMESYAPKGCKYNPLPTSLESRAFTSFTGEVRAHDVFGLQSTVKRHVLRLTVPSASLLTVQVEVHRDTPATLTVDAYRHGQVGVGSARVLAGSNLLGCGGDDTKAFLRGALTEQELDVDIVFELVSVELAASQVDARVAEARCWPVRLDLVAVPQSRAPLHWPTSCPAENRLPPSLAGKVALSGEAVLGDQEVLLPPQQEPFVYLFADERPWINFERALWNGIIEVPARLHRFARIFIRTSFRFASSPLQLAIELFDLKDSPDSTALAPKCLMGCLGGVPVYNGQVLDHAMPTGFKYRLWLLAAGLGDWSKTIKSEGRQCLEFNLDYSIKFEERLTPFEVGPAAWLCESSRLPGRIVQTSRPWATDKLQSQDQLVAGRSIWIRDRFGFPPDETADMEHRIEMEVSEASVFRATTHHSDGVDVYIALTRKGETDRACKTLKHPGPVPRQTIFCVLQPGLYVLTFFADYPLGGLHPCSDFFAQIALRPTALANEDRTKSCIAEASDLSSLQVQRSLELTTTPQWKAIKVPINFEATPSTVSVWTNSITISQDDAAERLFMRLVLHSDYLSSDLRFQVRYSGRYIADTQVTSHGYADMIGPLDPGVYYVDMYYVAGTNGPENLKLCSTSMVDLRLVSKSAYGRGNATAQWLCTSTRVPPPDSLTPQPDEQVLLDSEYVVPDSGSHTIRLKVEETRLVRVKLSSSDVDFTAELRSVGETGGESLVARGSNSLEVVVKPGTFKLQLTSSSGGAGLSVSGCSAFLLNLLLQPTEALPICPWSPKSSDSSAAAEVQKGAADHMGNLMLDLVPRAVSKDLVVKPPVSLWMSQGMEKTFDLTVESTAAVRIEVTTQPPFIPLEVTIRRKRASGKLETAIGTGEWTESRLLLMQSELPKGNYIVEFRQPRRYTIQPGSGLSEDDLNLLCSHVTIQAEVGVSSKEAVNTLRSELLDLPDLLAVESVPQSLNSVGWLGSTLLPVVGTSVFRFKQDTEKLTLKVDEESVLRVVSEPADLSNADIGCELLQGSTKVATADRLGQLLTKVTPGSYELALTPQAKSPFLVTMGLVAMTRLTEDVMLQDSGTKCLQKFPDLSQGVDFANKGWTIGPRVLRLKSSFRFLEGMIGSIPIELKTASIVYLESGSSLPLELVRVALKVPEGLWVGEQRGYRNSLEIELPPGSYEVQLTQPKTLDVSLGGNKKRCLEFSIQITATPLAPSANADRRDAAEELSTEGSRGTQQKSLGPELSIREEASVESAPCFAMGTLPLPLDFSDPKGGSSVMGGPIDKTGRLLVRTHALLTDMHDGRKKVYLKSWSTEPLQLKIGVILGGHARFSMASQLAFSVLPPGSTALDPVEAWDTPDGWERVYMISASSAWLAFHHNHRERSESACLHFGLQLEIHPVSDVARMMSCPSDAVAPEDIIPKRFDVKPGFFKFIKRRMMLKQSQAGFISETRFTLTEPAFVSIGVGFNFFLSHAEVDIVEDKDTARPSTIVFGERDFYKGPSDALNAQLTIGHRLEPGNYILRLADDHYNSQVSGEACFPFSLDFRLVPDSVGPTVLYMKPHPSVPVTREADLVLTIRFSQPPKGSIDDVVRSITLGGVSAMTGGSWSSMDQKFATSKKSRIVQATTSEGHLVWTIGWNAQSLPRVGTAKLEMKGLVSNGTGKAFSFNSPVYTIVSTPKGSPWAGGALSPPADGAMSSPEAPVNTPPVPEVMPNLYPKPEAKVAARTPAPVVSAPDTPVGDVMMEGSQQAPSNPNEGVGRAKSEDGAAVAVPDARAGEISSEGKGMRTSYDEDSENHAPVVEEWSPLDPPDSSNNVGGGGSSSSSISKSSASSAAISDSTRCPDGFEKNAETGDCEASSSAPVGYKMIFGCCCLAAAALYYMFQQPRSPARSTAAARFKDIGSRTAEEELGLVGAANYEDDEEDML